MAKQQVKWMEDAGFRMREGFGNVCDLPAFESGVAAAHFATASKKASRLPEGRGGGVL